jgi:hypothetical protein
VKKKKFPACSLSAREFNEYDTSLYPGTSTELLGRLPRPQTNCQQILLTSLIQNSGPRFSAINDPHTLSRIPRYLDITTVFGG